MGVFILMSPIKKRTDVAAHGRRWVELKWRGFAGSFWFLYFATQTDQASPIGNCIQDYYNGFQVGLWLKEQ
ncbi:hypothetical protein DTL42_14235 [Bremerella cremea]|uniref:Uncharacterized protein n=1 Tax=Bremerella cremea TaxID=1031537 RepID=A0A368KSH8_9BACT|nr:hypothetical protein DTL42_14235 [Bremerella cremea]